MPRLPSPPATGRTAPGGGSENYAQSRLHEWLKTSIILGDDWDQLDPARKAVVRNCREQEDLLQALVGFGLLNNYQASRLRAGKTDGLVLGSYRVVDRLGAGGMGVIYLAEHVKMRKRVAVKTLSWTTDQDEKLVSRFYAEIRAVAKLRHQNIVSAIDAGEHKSI